MALSSAKFENVSDGSRKEAESVARQLKGSSGKRSATIKLEGLMLKLVRELTDIVLRHPGVVIVPLDRELSPDAVGKILGISRPLVVRRMDDGSLPFRYEGKHRRCKLDDVLKLKAAEGKETVTSQAVAETDDVRHLPGRAASVRKIDDLVLGTTNAPDGARCTSGFDMSTEARLAGTVTREITPGSSRPILRRGSGSVPDARLRGRTGDGRRCTGAWRRARQLI